MIDHLRHMAVFARVVDEGSFRAAARDLNLAPSRVSEIVSDLEDQLRTTLLYRSTRKIALTNEGRLFYTRVCEMIRSAETGINELNAQAVEPVGALNVSMPSFMSSSALTHVIGEFARAHPRVDLSIKFSDRQLGLIDAGLDLNIRAGWLDDSALMSRKLGEEDRMLVAGSAYAAARPEPKHLSDLEQWDWIRYAQRLDTMEFLSPDGSPTKVTGTSQLRVDSVDALYTFAVQNLGATVIPSFLAARGLQTGQLVQLLPEWRLAPLGLYAVWPDKSRRESLTLLFVRYMAEHYTKK